MSPFHETFDLTCCIEEPRYFGISFALFLPWIVAQAVLTVGLLQATLVTFDRNVGRIQG